MRAPAFVSLCALAGCSTSVPESNTPFGLYVNASVTPTVVSLRDSGAVLDIRITTDNRSDRSIVLATGGPPFVFTPDPAYSAGLQQSFRIARPGNPLTAGPGADWWAGAADTFPAHHAVFSEQQVTWPLWRDGATPPDTGEYTIRSYFNGREGASTTFRVVP